jgi:hypothetical protein
MTTPTDTPTVDAVLALLQHDLDALGDPQDLIRQAMAIETKRSALEGAMQTIRRASVILSSLGPQIAQRTKVQAQMITLHERKVAELAALPTHKWPTDREVGERQRLDLAIRMIETGEVPPMGYSLSTLLGPELAELGYVAPDPPRDEPFRKMDPPWPGSLAECERRLKSLQAQQADAEQALAAACLSEAEREQQAADIRARNARPRTKTRADGSQWLQHQDGTTEEVEAVTP